MAPCAPFAYPTTSSCNVVTTVLPVSITPLTISVPYTRHRVHDLVFGAYKKVFVFWNAYWPSQRNLSGNHPVIRFLEPLLPKQKLKITYWSQWSLTKPWIYSTKYRHKTKTVALEKNILKHRCLYKNVSKKPYFTKPLPCNGFNPSTKKQWLKDWKFSSHNRFYLSDQLCQLDSQFRNPHAHWHWPSLFCWLERSATHCCWNHCYKGAKKVKHYYWTWVLLQCSSKVMWRYFPIFGWQ